MDSIPFAMPPDLGVKGRVKALPGLKRADEEDEGNEVLEDMVPEQSASVTARELLENDGTDGAPAAKAHEIPEASDEAPRKSARIDTVHVFSSWLFS